MKYDLELTIVWVENLSDQKKEPLLCKPTHVQPWFTSKRDLQLLLEVMLFASDLVKWVWDEVRPPHSKVQEQHPNIWHLPSLYFSNKTSLWNKSQSSKKNTQCDPLNKEKSELSVMATQLKCQSYFANYDTLIRI